MDGMLVHCMADAIIKFASTHSYTWVEGGNVRGKVSQEMRSPVVAWTWQTLIHSQAH